MRGATRTHSGLPTGLTRYITARLALIAALVAGLCRMLTKKLKLKTDELDLTENFAFVFLERI